MQFHYVRSFDFSFDALCIKTMTHHALLANWSVERKSTSWITIKREILSFNRSAIDRDWEFWHFVMIFHDFDEELDRLTTLSEFSTDLRNRRYQAIHDNISRLFESVVQQTNSFEQFLLFSHNHSNHSTLRVRQLICLSFQRSIL